MRLPILRKTDWALWLGFPWLICIEALCLYQVYCGFTYEMVWRAESFVPKGWAWFNRVASR